MHKKTYLCGDYTTVSHTSTDISSHYKSLANTRDRGTTMAHFLKYTGVFGGVQGAVMLINVVRNKLTTKLLDIVGFGLLAEYSAIPESLHGSTNFGIPFSSVRRAAELFEQGDEKAITDFVSVVRTWCLWIGLFGAIVCVVGAYPLSIILFDGCWQNTLRIMCLSPMLVCMGITAGEASILKGLRRLKRIAIITVCAAVLTLMLTVPIYWLMGIDGIILAMNISTAGVMVVHLSLTLPLYRWNVSLLSADTFHAGWSMIKIGVPYVLAAVAGSFMSMAIIAILKRNGGDEIVGLYRVGYIIMGTYACLVFAAFEADFFPRLSSVNDNIPLRNELVNKQIDVSVLLMGPLLVAILVMMPVIIDILYTPRFLPATAMAVCAVFYPFLRALSVPISYMALARGDSHIYLAAEVIYDFVSVMLIWVCFTYWGLIGAGIGLSLSALFDILLVGVGYGIIYKIRLSPATIRYAAVQAGAVVATTALCLATEGWIKYALGALLIIASSAYSFIMLKRNNSFDEIWLKVSKKKTDSNTQANSQSEE